MTLSKQQLGTRGSSTSPRTSRKATAKPSNDRGAQFDKELAVLLRGRYGLTEQQYVELHTFAAANAQERVNISRQLVSRSILDAVGEPDLLLGAAVHESESLLKGYATLDEPHRTDIARLVREITAYLRDPTRQRPFNALMIATPGAGKSHFIRRLAETMKADRVRAVTFNMATMQSADDMSRPVDELRNVKVNDQFPLLFLDEFDSDVSRYSILLPLLWDGELQVGHRDLKLGKSVIVLAGSGLELPKTMTQYATMDLNGPNDAELAAQGKLLDLLSRINGGVISIPDLDLQTEHRDRRVDKVCVTIALLRDRFGPELKRVPRAFLRFIAHTTFRYHVRSIAHLVDLVSHEALRDGDLALSRLGLPLKSELTLQESSLRLHVLDTNRAFGIVKRWSDYVKDDAMASTTLNFPLSQLAWR